MINKDFNPFPKGFQHPGSWRFSIGEYGGKMGVCVTLHCGKIGEDGYQSFHLHDYFGFVPRFIRIGIYVLILDRKAVNFYSKGFPDWKPYLKGYGPQPLLEFEK